SGTVQQMGDFYGCEATFLTPDHEGFISPDVLKAALKPDSTLVSLMLANNEIGTILPIADLAEIAHQHDVLFHTDAVQAGGQLPLRVKNLNVDMLSLSAHKFYGPKGVGVLFVRDGIELLPSQSGGSHEQGRRAGTLNVPLIVGLAKALEIAYSENHAAEFARRRDRLIEGILQRVPDSQLTGSRTHRLPSHASFVFQHVDGNLLLMHLDRQGIAASSGSACKTGNPKPSEVLLTLGYNETWALGGLRLSVGRQTTDEHITTVLDVLPAEIEKVRTLTAMTR
ncbi:MAG: cysteine desulfurase, partial [Anaerolineae bacterium]|nr:cysteine desulfurase [Anaerolineae bacterium]